MALSNPTRLTLFASSFFPGANNDSASITANTGDILTFDAVTWQQTGTNCLTSVAGLGGLSGLSFTLIDQVYQAPGFAYAAKAWVAVVGTGGTGQIRLTVDTSTCLDCQFEVLQWTGADLTTPIVRGANTGDTTSNGTYGPIAIADRSSANNKRHAFFMTATTFSSTTANGAYTKLTDTAGFGGAFFSEYGATNTDPDFSGSVNNGNAGYVGIAYEMAEASAAAASGMSEFATAMRRQRSVYARYRR
jgi:hypothetical protein